MEAVRKSQPQMPAPPQADAPQPKLTIEKFADGAIACLKLTGMIDESFDGKKIARSIQCDTLVLDLGGVKKISSFGIREWVDFIGTATKQVKQLVLIECTPKVVDQLNMVANFAGGGRVFSFYAPFRCDYCDSDQRVLLEVSKDFEAIKAMKLAERPCPKCKESMYFDEDGSTFFSYVLGQGAFELEPDLVTFLAAKLDYRVGTIDQKLHVDKIIEGRVTYLRLAGDLNNTFPRDKLAEGLEGTVILDVAQVPRVEPAGAAEWRNFMRQITPLVEHAYLIGVPAAFLERLCSKDDLGAKGAVLDFMLPYVCGACGQSGAQSIDVAQHHDVLKFATAPELRCSACKAAMQCAASEATMTVLPNLPAPALAKDLERQVAALRTRKLDKKPMTGMMPPMPVAEKRSSVVPIVLLLLLVAGAIGAVLYVVKLRGVESVGPNGKLVARSAAARPDWIAASATPASATCTDDGGGLSCLGVSDALPSQADAEDAASDAAIEAIAFEVGNRIRDDKWARSVPPLYVPAREAKLAALGRDPQSTQARREVGEGRHAVALALRGVTPNAAGRYWEAFETREGRRYVAFVQVKVAPAEIQRLVDTYTKPQAALGALAVGFFPELAWKFPRLAKGAVIVALAPGSLQQLGVAEHSVVIAVNGRETPDAASFAKILGEERSMVEARGGSLRLMVQADSGDPREFSQTFPGRAVTTTPTEDSKKPHGHHHTGSGGVNVWDRFGGNHGSGRDDPTQ